MKLRLGLVVLLSLPLMVKGQTETPATKVGVKFYSNGPVYVNFGAETDGSKSASTTMHIVGSAEFGDGSSIVQKGRTEITEDFINSKNPATPSNLFVSNPANKNEGVIAFIGASNKQSIKGSGVFGQKAKNWIAFPTIRVEKTFFGNKPYENTSLDPRKYNYLAVDSSAAVMVDYLVVPGNNRFAVEGGYAADPSKLNMGQALFKTEPEAAIPAAYSQVNLDMYRYVSNSDEDGGFNANNEASTANNTLRNTLGENYMTGFTSPFWDLGADYFFYHALTKPSSSSFNSWAGNIVDPYTKLQPGVGYFMSMEVSDFDHKNNINPRWIHDMDANGDQNRARGGFVFNRAVMEDYMRRGYAGKNQYGFSRFAYLPNGNPDQTKAIDNTGNPTIGNRDRHLYMEANSTENKGEKFVVGDVKVYLKAGFNFLGNPFMSPISLNYMLGIPHNYPTWKNYTGATDIDMPTALDENLFGSTIKVSSVYTDDAQDVLRAKYWLINTATVKYKNADGMMHFKATYDYISRVGGSTGAIFKTQLNPDDDPGNPNVVAGIAPEEYVVAPMQMFGLQASRDFEITLSPKLRTFGSTRFQKSLSAANEDLVKDYLVVEVVSPVEKTADRTAVVMREGASLDNKNGRDPYDTRKGVSKTMEGYDPTEKEDGKNRTYPEPSTSLIYTKSSDGESLLGNGVPMNTKEVPLYVTPPATQQTMIMNFYNLDNMVSVPNVWLIDRHANKTVKLTPGYSYEFSSGPSDLKETANRFILRFWGDDDEIIKKDKEISVYYNTSTLHISGLIEDDVNSDVMLYDLQGRLIGKTKVKSSDTPSMEYLKPLSLGTYVVKITGKRNFASKFVNLQN